MAPVSQESWEGLREWFPPGSPHSCGYVLAKLLSPVGLAGAVMGSPAASRTWAECLRWMGCWGPGDEAEMGLPTWSVALCAGDQVTSEGTDVL